MAKVKVSKRNIDEELFIRSGKIKINNKCIKTPVKSFNMPNLRRDTKVNSSVKGVNEVFKLIKSKDIEEYCLGARNESKLYSNIQTSTNKTSKDEVNLCFTQLNDNILPNEKGIDFLTNLSYINSDITPLPLIHSLFNGEDIFNDFQIYIGFMDKCIESINRLNNKAILGIIPGRMPSIFTENLIDFYHSHDITSFAFDFQGRIHSNFKSQIRELITNVLKLDLSNESFLYSCNTQRGKVTHGTSITKGNDIAVYNYGFDVMGDSHVKISLPPSVAENIKKRADNELNIRLFNSSDYGHYKYSNLDAIKSMYPFDETDISINSFEGKNKKALDCQKLFNNERIGLELNKYSSIINNDESNYDYLSTKTHIGGSLDQFRVFRQQLNYLL